MSWLSKGVKALGGIVGGKKSNAYSAPNLSFLRDMSGLSYLKDSPVAGYSSGEAEGLFRNYLDSVNARGPVGESQFREYLGNISAPSSVDEVRRGVEGEQLQNTLRDINRQTDQTVASTKLDFQDRGLGGPNQMSDIEAIGLAQARGKGEELASSARLELYQKELDRQKAREEAARTAYGQRYAVGAQADLDKTKALDEAYGTRYAAGVSADSEARQIGNQNKNLYAQLLNQRDLSYGSGLLGSADAYARNQVNTPGLFETMIRNYGNNWASAQGNKLGGG